MSVRVYQIENPQQDYIKLWDDLVDEAALPPQSYYAWKPHLEKVFGVSVFALLILNGDRATGFCMFYVNPNNRTAYSCQYGFFAKDEASAQALLQEVLKICDHHKIPQTLITSGSSAYVLECASESKTSLYLPLGYEDDEALWLSLPKKTKNMVRKAQKSEYELETDWQLLKKFYGVYTDRFIEKKVGIKPLQHFQALKEDFGDRVTLLSATKNGEYLGGSIFVSGAEIVSYAFNASDMAASNNGVNNMLMWEAMKMFRAQGKTYIDLSESKLDSPVYKYKSRLSKDIEAKTIFYYDFLKADQGNFSVPPSQSFWRNKMYGFLQRVYPVMPKTFKKRYLLHLGQKGRLV